MFGDPSAPIVECNVGKVPCIYLYREGKEGIERPPGNVNHRGNVWALKENGCTHVIGITLDGTLSNEMKPGDIVVLQDFIDCTSGRQQTFHDGEFGSPPGKMHVPMIPSFSEGLRQCVVDSANEAAINVISSGVAAVLDGPSFATSADAVRHKNAGAKLINWCTSPEAILAKEAGLLYVGLSLVTYDARVQQTQLQMTRNTLASRSNMDDLLRVVIDGIGIRDWDKEISELLKSLGTDDTSCTCTEYEKREDC
nr:S-methyl-5'-thioadenosine phosphorylase-like isoform X2 [Onthophagus taurus]XP_022906040.1 S-methyl-5'-thioadenosine phosphorylase-like isoform X2 [Onthophagus taurus]XP_022906042.1 S-methyl-5'-thioadenosine phosphorylase-like isoform X2 [Onthophagus taurus]